jgi:hypothetical protein
MKTVTIQGVTYRSIADAIKALAPGLGVTASTVRGRIGKGWSLEDALTMPCQENRLVARSNGAVTYRGEEYPSLTALANEHGIPANTAHARIRRGWSIEDAVEKPLVVRECGKHRTWLPPSEDRPNKKWTYLYGKWVSMKARCHTPTCTAYPSYGGKGTAVCDEWRFSFDSFREWALPLVKEYRETYGSLEGMSIDRIDPEKDYSPENCRFIPLSDNVARRGKGTDDIEAAA